MTTHTDGTTDGTTEQPPAQPPAPPADPAVSRRRLLRFGAGGAGGPPLLGAGAAGGRLAGWRPGGVGLKKVLGMTGTVGSVPDAAPGAVHVEKVRSAARGREVTMVTMLPPGATASTNLPVCVLLHGRGNDAQGMVALGTPQFLAAAVKA
ncbi:hypothetical protein AB0O00_40150, partial [Kitasatospora sp. NPDC093558]